jgi:DNA-directed RNA polymerase sigma subunit (sigma70/sigma32)
MKKSRWQKMLDQCAARDRRVRYLFHTQGETMSEIARRHGITRQRVWQIVRERQP